MSAENQHTPIPWKTFGEMPDLWVASTNALAGNGDMICEMPLKGEDSLSAARWEANAEFIVLACNNFDSLLDACRKVVNWYENAGHSDPDQKSTGSVELWAACKKAIEGTTR